jgi:hypothetical protein
VTDLIKRHALRFKPVSEQPWPGENPDALLLAQAVSCFPLNDGVLFAKGLFVLNNYRRGHPQFVDSDSVVRLEALIVLKIKELR